MRDEQDTLNGKPEPSRALVPLERADAPVRTGSVRPLAPFIAQVLACRARLPDFRPYRRAEPADAAAHYGAAPAAPPGGFERIL